MTRVTQNMITQRSLSSLQTGLSRLSTTQEQLSSGKAINRPSDSPVGTASAMRLRTSIAVNEQYQTNATDGLAWLGEIDTTLGSVTDQLRTARDLAVQGNSGSIDQTGRDALATQVDQVKASILSAANTTYLDRPVFGGTTSGTTAYDSTGAYTGTSGSVSRTVGDSTRVRVDADAQTTFGADGDNVFTHLDALSTALRSGDQSAIASASATLSTDIARVTASRAEAGSRYSQIEQAQSTASTQQVSLKSSLSSVEDVDMASAVVNLQIQQTAYQAALTATSRVMSPSLADFLK
ncbi:flagellar hook-associated protein 3 [Nocardioides mangrovicus]|uniref:Flagellar hook-associated protein 3 n=1 Tax=Nocardioides mangrovicus TaxID=2478913 RepID=A0A3L8P035_9ACTN|nr:flagellar hook-associated protein FlgL [Nocardioides mangrovicus]RLV48795.1 flagellar hook-associated protein 3 [Nocardioides mangrovicus]